VSGRRLQHLERRQGIYYVRLPIPADIASILGRRELRWSLKTRDRHHAGQATLAATVAFREFCAKMRGMMHAPEDALRAAVRDFFLQRLKQVRPPERFSGETQDDDRKFVIDMSQDLITGLQALAETEMYAGSPEDPTGAAAGAIADGARDVAERLQVDLSALAESERMMLFQGVARALIEEQRYFLHRLTDRLSPYQPADEFLAPTFYAAHAGANGSPPVGMTPISEALAAYIAAKAGVKWTARTELEQRRVLRWIEEFFGSSTRLDAITKDKVRAFRDALMSLRFKGAANAPFAELIGAPDAATVSRKTARKYFEYLIAACNWWVAEGLLNVSPVGNVNVIVPKGKKSGERVVFTQPDLKALFSSPMFTGCAGPTRRMRPGPQTIKDDYYWIPLIGALSGMRLGEIVQLGLDDVHLDGAVPFFRVRVNPLTGGSVKSDAGWRDVPVHARLSALGFEEFVKFRTQHKQSARLFFNVPFGSDGSASGEYSRWFGRRMTEIGLKRPGLVFHSFRGAFIGALLEADTPLHVVKAIVGHELSDDITVGYSGHEGVSLAQKRKWIDEVALLDDLPPT
jgi:integrase